VCIFYAIIISCIYLTVQLLSKFLTHFKPHVLEMKCETHINNDDCCANYVNSNVLLHCLADVTNMAAM